MEARTSPVFQSYVDAFDELSMRPDRVALRYLDDDVHARELRSAIYRHARALAALGVARGSLVALFAPNCPDALAIRYAANHLGAATMFLPALADSRRCFALLERIRPTLLVAFAETASLTPDVPDVRMVTVGFGPASSRLDALARAQPDVPMRGRARPDDLAVIASSGGTTGVPKASCRSFAAYASLVNGPRAPQQRRLVNGALAYLSQVLVDTTLIGGGVVVLRHRYDAADTLATIEAERITDVLLVEPQLFETMDHRDVARRDLSSLRAITHVGGSAPVTLRRRAIERFGAVLVNTYGASEAGLVSVLRPADYEAHPAMLDSAGRLLPDVDVRVRRADGTLAGAGEHGGIEVKSKAVARGYRNQPAEQALKFRGGWCLTGDIGMIDDDGCLHVLGRAGDVAEIDGVAIGPAQLEDALCQLPDVRYAVAFGARDTAQGDAWHVVVEPWSGRRVDLADCVNALEAVLGASVARAVRIAEIERVPMTEQGKADRAAIEARCFGRDAATSNKKPPCRRAA